MMKTLRLALVGLAVVTVFGSTSAFGEDNLPEDPKLLQATARMLQSSLKSKDAEIARLKEEIVRLKRGKATAEAEVSLKYAEVFKLKEEIASLEAKVKVATPKATPTTTPAPIKQEEAKDKKSPFVDVVKGNLRLGIAKAVIGPVPLVNEITGAKSMGEGKDLILLVGIGNLSDGKKLNYSTWGADAMKFMGSSATLSDDLGNTYKRVHFGAVEQPAGRVKSASVYPGKSVFDVLVFEEPVEKANWLILTLPLENVEGGKDEV